MNRFFGLLVAGLVAGGCASRNAVCGPGVAYVDEFDLSVSSCGLDWWAHNNEALKDQEGRPRGEERARDVGFDDFTGPARDAAGRILPNRSFPDMRA